MTHKEYYIEFNKRVEETLDHITDLFPCFLTWEPIEMGYIKVWLSAREEDMAGIENLLAPLV